MKILSYTVVIIVILIGVTFASLNAQPVTINYYVAKQSMPLSLLLALTLLLGAILGLLASMIAMAKMKRENMTLRKRANVAEKEIDNLRSIPLKDHH